MKELFYFDFANLMVRVDYNKEANALRYASHRKLTSSERMIVEQYLLSSVATKTDYYKRHPSQFVYLGQDARLAKKLDLFHVGGTSVNPFNKEKDVLAAVEGVINQSMQNYYFEQIGDTILDMRQELRNDAAQSRIAPLRRKMEELIEAYNHYSEQKISVAEVIPPELQSHFGFAAQPRTFVPSCAQDGIV